MCYIYKITNTLNRKSYIGKTIRPPEVRWSEHKKNFKKLQDDMVVHVAMYKYRKHKEKFTFEVLEEVLLEEIDEKEKYWIKYYDTYYNGYNSTLGGDGANIVDYELIRELWYDNKTIQEICAIMNIERHTVSNALRTVGITKKEMSSRSIGKKVLQYSLDGILIAKYESISEASRIVGKTTNISNIKGCCTGKTKSAYNFLWKFEDDDTDIIEKVEEYNKSGKGKVKQVEQYSLDGELLNTYNSCREAARAINAPYHVGINSCCLGKQKTAYGYKWKYKI